MLFVLSKENVRIPTEEIMSMNTSVIKSEVHFGL